MTVDPTTNVLAPQTLEGSQSKENNLGIETKATPAIDVASSGAPSDTNLTKRTAVDHEIALSQQLQNTYCLVLDKIREGTF